ncbi:MAG: class I SAM-dependent methyltransferase [Bacteriovoracia bacterium]
METGDLQKYRGQWGGGIQTADGRHEEMWWSEPNRALAGSAWARWRFRLDVRHYFILRFWGKFLRSRGAATLPRVIDFGCGSGGTTMNFSHVFWVPIQGVDIFETQLKVARQNAQALGSACTFERLGEGGSIPVPDASIDVVLSLDVLGHVPDIPAVLNEFRRVLKPGGAVLLFTESTYSDGDRSIMARLARSGADMMTVVPEHISLFPRERLEELFGAAGFTMLERVSANVGHFFFFPKDYVMLLRGRAGFTGWKMLASFWNRLSKLTPFYPKPLDTLRLALTLMFGRRAYGTSYFYYLRKN